MRKSKMISFAAAALLTVVPVIVPTVVHAADATSTNTVSNSTTSITNNTTGQATPISASPLSVEFTQEGQQQSINPDGMYFQVAKNSSFNPLGFTGSNGTEFKMIAANNQKITVDSNTVDTSKTGDVGTVRLTVGSNTVTYHVFVAPTGTQEITTAWIRVSLINQAKTAVQDGPTLGRGTKIFVGNETAIIDGESYTKISRISEYNANHYVKTERLWMRTKDISGAVSNMSNDQTDVTTTRMVMHSAVIYDANGKSTGKKLPAYRTVSLATQLQLINGSYCYQIAGNSNQYIKASNIDGTKRTLKKNAYVYATSTRRADRTLLRKGTTITTYGGSYKFKNGKRYYRIEGATATNKRYVKVVNFE